VFFSVIVPAYNAEKSLPQLMAALAGQTYKDFEVIIVDDGSTDRTAALAAESGFFLIKTGGNRGPAHARNVGAAASRGTCLVFTDADCVPRPDWMEAVALWLADGKVDALMGRVVLEESNWLGNTISALGFPAGGAVGFDKVWKVDAAGNTTSFSTCNCAVKKEVFRTVGGFDESFPYPGGEDSLLARNIVAAGRQIRYCPRVVVHHAARSNFREFLQWQFKRGVSSYIFSKKVTEKSSFLKLRLWSAGNVLAYGIKQRNLLAVAFFLALSYLAQFAGFLSARYDRKIYASTNH
jgi:glycosyltransferase involved in cell wall biosynthesis